MNLMCPDDPGFVTIDGHMSCAWQGKNLTMKEAVVKTERGYREIANATKFLANVAGILPNQFQATVWFARKRTAKVKYDPQLDLFGDPCGICYEVNDLVPYPRRDD